MVSVILPVYNTEKYLDHCIESIIKQSYQDFEIIAINDGSLDQSLSILERYATVDSRIHVYSQENKGVSAARNYGLDLASGDYVLFIDSDDWIEPDMIEVLVHNLEETKTDISCCQYDRNIDLSLKECEVWDSEKALEEFLFHRRINGSLVNKLFKRKLLFGISHDSSIRYGEDALFCWKVFMRAKSICVSNNVLYHVVLHDDSASGAGSYKPIRKDCITVWNTISNDASNISENLGEMAKAQLANMAFFSFYEMAYYSADNKDHFILYRDVLKQKYYWFRKASFISLDRKIFAFLICLNGAFGYKMIELRARLRRK